MISIQMTDIADLEALAVSISDFENQTGYRVMEGGVLPPEFILKYLEKFRLRPKWLGVWAIEDGVVIGSGLFKSALIEGAVEIGYGVAPAVEGRGVATLMARTMVEYAFGSGAETVFAHTLPDALASQRVLQKVGMSFDRLHDDKGMIYHRFAVTCDAA